MKRDPVRQIGWNADDDPEQLIWREWIVTNGLGGYASGSLGGVITRRYHGRLIAALAAPLGRTVMLNHLLERLIAGKTVRHLSAEERQGSQVDLAGDGFLRRFELVDGLPIWWYEDEHLALEKRVVMPHGQNTSLVSYRIVRAAEPVILQLTPSIHFRPHEEIVSASIGDHYAIHCCPQGWEIRGEEPYPPLRLAIAGAAAELIEEENVHTGWIYRLERDRGYDSEGPLWSPGRFEIELAPQSAVHLIASTEEWVEVQALAPDLIYETELARRSALLERAGSAAIDEVGAKLVLAADQFIISPETRAGDLARGRAAGDESRTIIAGYHWFTDWGRDTMISLEGLTLSTGRFREAGSILRTFAGYIRRGLIPNMFPEKENEGLYHTADATPWFFHALHRYAETTGDRKILRTLLPKLIDIVDHHVRGTDFGIRIDPADGLVTQGADGYQLTWMDAKVDGWVVTPRRGKAVEINALFYNALKLLESWCIEFSEPSAAEQMRQRAATLRESFNRRFWYASGGWLYDVVDGESGDDPALRPNQLFAISLDHPVLDRSRWEAVLSTVERELLTPVGLRSLARDHPDYQPRYDGDLRARDAAYHQGTVWGWLIGPFLDAWTRCHPGEERAALRLLDGFTSHLGEACIGTISEVFDAEPGYTARGCAAQAWSVAEVLRCRAALTRLSRER